MKTLMTTVSNICLSKVLMATIMTAGLAAFVPVAAHADDWQDHEAQAHDWAMHHDHDHDRDWQRDHHPPVIVNQPPVIVRRPPVIVEQPPVVYAPPAVVEEPEAPSGLNLIIPLNFK